MTSSSRNPLDLSTLPSMSDSGATADGNPRETLGLVVLWARDEPQRVGEILLLPPHDPRVWTFGRGGAPNDADRLSLVRQRPVTVSSTGALTCPRISRVQLRLSSVRDSVILVHNIGRCALHHRGREVVRAEVSPGERLLLQNELLFLCIRRGPMIPAATVDGAAAMHAFGEPDALGVVGESPGAWALRHRIEAVARQEAHVIVFGPSGSGKELVAQAIHARSARGGRAIVSRNAATIPEGLADAELFGNIRNYPNPGVPERPGLVGQAHGSTLFLDEFAELPRSVQAHLLRVMDDGEYQRLGEASVRRADLRIVAATNRPESELRDDVLARFKARITVPGLNARREDIPLIAAHLMRKRAAGDATVAARFFSNGDPRGVARLSPVLVEALVGRDYTTHVRELDAILLEAALESRGRYLTAPPGLPFDRRDMPTAPPPSDRFDGLTQDERLRLAFLRRHRLSPTACGRDAEYPGNRQTADFHLRQLICKTMQLADWDSERAAELLAGERAGPLRERSASRIAKFLSNLRARMAGRTEEQLFRELADEWKGNAELVRNVVVARREKRVRPQ